MTLTTTAATTQQAIKTCHFYFDDNFGIRRAILIILSSCNSEAVLQRQTSVGNSETDTDTDTD